MNCQLIFRIGCPLFLFVIGACKKNNDTVTFEVLDYGSHTPVAGVRINLFRCTAFLPDGRCRQTQNFESATTDAEGKATVSQSSYDKADEGFEFSKDGYLNTRSNATKVSMDKLGIVNLQLVPPGANPAFDWLVVFACNDRFCYQVTDTFSRPTTPVTMTVKAFEGQVNTIKWEGFIGSPFNPNSFIKTKSGQVPNITVPNSGVVTINLY